MKKIVISLMLIICFSLIVSAQEKKTKNTLRLSDGQVSPPATLAEMNWLAGHWTGDAFGGLCEEIWSPARDGAMMGMFRLINNGKATFYEMMTIVEENGTIILRLKHFSPKLIGWEEKTKTVDFKFVGNKDGAIHFEGLTFKPEGKNSVTIYLAVEQKDGPAIEEVIRYRRVSEKETVNK